MPNEPPLFALPCRTQRRPAPLACIREHEPTKKVGGLVVHSGLGDFDISLCRISLVQDEGARAQRCTRDRCPATAVSFRAPSAVVRREKFVTRAVRSRIERDRCLTPISSCRTAARASKKNGGLNRIRRRSQPITADHSACQDSSVPNESACVGLTFRKSVARSVPGGPPNQLGSWRAESDDRSD